MFNSNLKGFTVGLVTLIVLSVILSLISGEIVGVYALPVYLFTSIGINIAHIADQLEKLNSKK